ncbi:MAG TPA: LuxR C-terminal-related transcriptional regulator [Gemmatimonadaceae bacterium]|nr:LuxR C-terminal-related transcriptional regulator [Gemmatimonadaceae bacterium]
MPRLLLIERAPHVTAALRTLLERDGHQVRVARSPRQALALCAGEAHDLLVVDATAGDRAALAQLRTLRRGGCDLPVLVLGGTAMPEPPADTDERATEATDVQRELPDAVRATRAAQALTASRLRLRYGLTDRQAAVAGCLADGLSNAEIARVLAISPYTARNHVEQVLAKLGVSSRARAGALLRRGHRGA